MNGLITDPWAARPPRWWHYAIIIPLAVAVIAVSAAFGFASILTAAWIALWVLIGGFPIFCFVVYPIVKWKRK